MGPSRDEFWKHGVFCFNFFLISRFIPLVCVSWLGHRLSSVTRWEALATTGGTWGEICIYVCKNICIYIVDAETPGYLYFYSDYVCIRGNFRFSMLFFLPTSYITKTHKSPHNLCSKLKLTKILRVIWQDKRNILPLYFDFIGSVKICALMTVDSDYDNNDIIWWNVHL